MIVSLLIISYSCHSQEHELKSTQHGLNMMLKDVPKDQLLSEMLFEHGADDNINVVRFDHIGPNLYPFIVSSSLPVATDSLGILSCKIQKDSLENFLEFIDGVTPKLTTRRMDQILLRITYRLNGQEHQYYLTNSKIVSGFLKIVEEKFKKYNDLKVLDAFYEFIGPMELQKSVHGKRTWIY